jgi:D-alanyl-D-alanine dipeptidase
VDSLPTAQEPMLTNTGDTSYIETIFKNYDLIDIRSLDTSIVVDLKYADTANFLKINLYGGLRKAYLNCETAIKLCNAQYFLKAEHPGYSLVVFDAARPLRVQQMMWDSLKLDSSLKYSYLAPPLQTSLHNYGCAVDLSILDLKNKRLLDMGTDFDHFGKLSQPAYEWYFLKDSVLSRGAHANRLLLRDVMKRAHFRSIPSEWWHFSICSKEEAVLRFKLIK